MAFVTFSIDAKGIEELYALARGMPGIVSEELKNTMKASLDVIEPKVLDRIPIVTGITRGSVFQQIRGHGMSLRGEVATTVLHGYALELGREPGKWPPVDAIEMWVVRKGIASPGPDSRAAAWAIAWKIKTFGTKGKHMFEYGWDDSEGIVIRLWDTAVDRIIARIAVIK